MAVTFEAQAPKSMLAARLHVIGEPMKIDEIPVPSVRPNDVLIEVKACGVVPNLRRVIGNFFGTNAPDRKSFPPLPAIFGLDATGVVAAVGDQVRGVRPGQRVYVNPARACGSCRMCRTERSVVCQEMTMQGYFGRSTDIMKAYPYGGLSQYQTAPATSLVPLPDSVSFAEAARFGYLGTAYSAVRKSGVGPGDTLLVNGVSGMLGVCAVIVGLAMGVKRVLGTGRNQELLDRVKSIAPDRISVYAMTDDIDPDPDEPERDAFVMWTRAETEGARVDGVVDCLPPGAPARSLVRAIYTLRRGGSAANAGAVTDNLPLNGFWMVANQISFQGSSWFTTAEAEALAAMAATGALDLSIFDHRVAPLNEVNEVLIGMSDNLDGGFANYVIDMDPVS